MINLIIFHCCRLLHQKLIIFIIIDIVVVGLMIVIDRESGSHFRERGCSTSLGLVLRLPSFLLCQLACLFKLVGRGMVQRPIERLLRQPPLIVFILLIDFGEVGAALHLFDQLFLRVLISLRLQLGREVCEISDRVDDATGKDYDREQDQDKADAKPATNAKQQQTVRFTLVIVQPGAGRVIIFTFQQDEKGVVDAEVCIVLTFHIPQSRVELLRDGLGISHIILTIQAQLDHFLADKIGQQIIEHTLRQNNCPITIDRIYFIINCGQRAVLHHKLAHRVYPVVDVVDVVTLPTLQQGVDSKTEDRCVEVYAEKRIATELTTRQQLVDLLSHRNDVFIDIERVTIFIEDCLVTLAELDRVQPHVTVLLAQVKAVWLGCVIVARSVKCYFLAWECHDDRVAVVVWVAVDRKYASWIHVLGEAHVHFYLTAPH